jgi:hypothetical protein
MKIKFKLFTKMNSAKAKKKETQTKKVKAQKGLNQKKKDSDIESTSLNYFRIVKELEKQKSVQNLSKEISKKDNKLQKNITELIYSKNSKKLGKFYDKNKNDLLLYGSSKFDVLTMDKLVNEMGNNKSKVINKIKENTHSNKNDIYSNLNNIDDSDNNKNKVILTPLCENEKERSDMEILEKKKFDEANRIGVVMRRIEYNCLLNNRNKKTHKNKEMINKMKNSVDKIERCWLRYRNRKNRIKNSNKDNKEINIKQSSDIAIGHFELEYISINSNTELEELKKKYDKLNELYLKTKKEMDKLNCENKELRNLLEETKNKDDKDLKEGNNEIEKNFNKVNDELKFNKNEFETLKDKITDNNSTNNNLDKVMEKIGEEKNDNKNNIISEDDINKIKEEKVEKESKENDNKNENEMDSDINKLKE